MGVPPFEAQIHPVWFWKHPSVDKEYGMDDYKSYMICFWGYSFHDLTVLPHHRWWWIGISVFQVSELVSFTQVCWPYEGETINWGTPSYAPFVFQDIYIFLLNYKPSSELGGSPWRAGSNLCRQRLGLQGDAYASDWFPTWFAQLLPLSQAIRRRDALKTPLEVVASFITRRW